MSTALIYPPGHYAKTEELIELAKVVSQYGGIYASHMRSEGTSEVKALEEANEASYTAAVALKDNQQQLFEMQKSQQELLALMKRSLDQLLNAISGNTGMVQ